MKDSAQRAIDPAAIYNIDMRRPVKVGLAVYRPGEEHFVRGDEVLAIIAAAGATPDSSEGVLVATRRQD
ncbi:hypothetical protein [Methylosinus sp. Sm6]|uniref:hypothetical protein n=1 Tax=Methylosinus sp. Sm6 TaxID=2866948 RepID=UPI001C9A14AE|nr:hypothetical protein [Methylosinus sp. Sm6]MBY6239804.1 hypothetical protein [Methylosinus sp. Sm6]